MSDNPEDDFDTLARQHEWNCRVLNPETVTGLRQMQDTIRGDPGELITASQASMRFLRRHAAYSRTGEAYLRVFSPDGKEDFVAELMLGDPLSTGYKSLFSEWKPRPRAAGESQA